MFFLVYRITNVVNGKHYTGAHKTTDKDDGYFGSSKILKRAVKKYGLENFKKVFLCECTNSEEMFAKEKELVVLGTDSYNLRRGGDGGWDQVNSGAFNPKHRDQHLEHLKRINDSMTSEERRARRIGTKAAQQTRDKMTATRLGKCFISALGKENCRVANLGKKASPETRMLQSLAKTNTFYIKNLVTKETRRIKITEVVPVGWSKGRIYSRKRG